MEKFASAPAQGANDTANKQANPNSNASLATDVSTSTTCQSLLCDAQNGGNTQ